MKQVRKVKGRTVTQFAKKMEVSVALVKKWIEEDRLNVVELRNGEPHGRSGAEPLLVLILDTKRPPRLDPGALTAVAEGS